MNIQQGKGSILSDEERKIIKKDIYHMKKLSLALALISLAANGMQARSLTPEEALGRLTPGHSVMRVGKAEMEPSKLRLAHTAVTSAGAPAVYVFDSEVSEGYLVVSADDVATPLLGYGDTGKVSSDDMPAQLRWWLGQYASEIEYAQSHEPVMTVSTSQWNAPDEFTPIEPLCATRWDQSSPYNNMCPLVNGQRAVTGCLATALAQVMKYHNWPERGRGQISYSDNYGAQRTMNFDVAFDWDNMLDSYTSSATAVQKSAVAQLMKACGYSVRMSYSADASGASDAYVVSALTNYFDYDKSARNLRRSYFGLAEWQRMIYDNLRNVGPVLYCGQAVEGGHAFVCDGYSSDGYFHFNWGWSGMYDGYFLLTALNPEGQGIGGFAGGYNYMQSITLGIRKNTGEAIAPVAQLTLTEVPTGTVSGSYLSLSGGWYNLSDETINFEIAAKVEPVDGTSGDVKYDVIVTDDLESYQGYSSLPINLSRNTTAGGTYKVSVVSRNANGADTDPWLEAMHAVGQPDFVIVKRTGNSYTVLNQQEGTLTVTDAEALTGFYYGCAAKIRFTVSNDNDVEVTGSILPGLVSNGSLVATGSGEFFDLMPGESVTRDMVFDWLYTQSFRKNTNYTLCLYDYETQRIYKTLGMVKVLDNPGANMRCDSFTLVGNSSAVDRNNICFSASVTCRSGYFAAPLYVLITTPTGGNVLQSAASDIKFLESGDAATSDFRISYPDAVGGTKYRAYLAYLNGNSWQLMKYIDFTISESGIGSVSGDEVELGVAYESATGKVIVSSGARVTDVIVTDAGGRSMSVPVSYDGNVAVADLAPLGRGVYIVTASDEAGAVRNLKLCR